MDNENVHGLDELNRRLDAAIHYFETDAKDVIGVESVKAFKQNFQDEGFFGDKWETRKSKRFGSTNNQKTLTKSGDLSESITYKISGNDVIIYSDKPYAALHNEGGEITVTPKMKKYFWAMHHNAAEIGDGELMEQYKAFAMAKKIVMKKRQFIGEHDELIDNITNKITRDLTKILNG